MTVASSVVAAVFVDPDPTRFLPCVRSLRRAHPDLDIVVGSIDPRRATTVGTVTAHRAAGSLAQLIAALRATGERRAILAISDPVLVPDAFLDRPVEILESDLRIASVSFLSNAAWLLSFPHRGRPTPVPPEGLDERSLTRRLRTMSPAPDAPPIPVAMGPAVLLASAALGAIGIPQPLPTFADSIADQSARGRRRGFVDLLDAGTFIARPFDLHDPAGEPWGSVPDVAALLQRHWELRDLIGLEARSDESPLGLALGVATVKITGLDLLIDGRCIGPREMGTQVQTLSVIEALAARDDVRRVGVALGDDTPAYARRILGLPKVRAERVMDDNFAPFDSAHIVHRPYQPDGRTDVDAWRRVGRRTLLTVQDLIAYHVGRYQDDSAGWLRYRRTMVSVTSKVDGVITVSADARDQVLRERLPVEPSRLFVVENGTDHLSGSEEAHIPAELLARGAVAEDFLVILGTNYAHKNRDLGIRAWRELRSRGARLGLVVAGASVPTGSSRIDEVQAASDEEGLQIISEVTSEERNWLLRHARALVYPSSAEGFGLVPYEAARNGTPAITVAFGPLREVMGDMPVSAAEWSPSTLADALERLLADPDLMRLQVAAALAAETRYTWARTAASLVGVYRDLMGRPPEAAPAAVNSAS